ncbi:MAG TPA: M23 family metallopeptidase [Vicinamibacteria bacterium]|jgi:murein DD-endopeptidase MepM/ murein hydrolase activator NlpD|nr:M23 family metallopeptidase [Vicinamibacteria bacterium]
MSRGRASAFPRLLLGLALAALVSAGAIIALRVGPLPKLTLRADRPALGRRTVVQLTAEEGGRGLSSVHLELKQGDRTLVLARRTYTPQAPWTFWGPRTERDEIKVEVGTDTVKDLQAGEAILRATALRVGAWLRHPAPVVEELRLPVRLTPPSLAVVSSQHYVAQGGAEAVVYRAGETAVEDGVRVGEWWFPGFPLPGGGPQDRFALWAVPYDLKDREQVRLKVVDDVGNASELAFVDRFTPKPFSKARLPISDSFLRKVVPEIRSNTPSLRDREDLFDTFLVINRDLRQANAEELKALAKGSAPRFLWKRPFLPMPKAKVMSAFADRRTYVYRGQEVDHQYHLGFDLAVTHRTPVPAANHGVVVLARYFGIYGNSVVIDHGYGLMSLYGHLSVIDVTKGQEVERGQTLGRTGATGLAGGDHLHFTMLLGGLPVNPNEWWDPHWIHDRLVGKLGSALPFEP